jgi:4-amino-4-deoxy-L-arabinose transferase-like glycosyltransferase
VLAVLACLCVFALVVRMWGIGYMLPMAKLGDSLNVVRQVEVLRSPDPPDYTDPAVNCYPFLLAHAVALFPDGARVAPDEVLDLPEHLHRASSTWREIRVMSVIFALFLVPGTWWLARRLLGDAWALVAAAFCATSLLHVDFSAQEPPHALVTSTILLAILAAIRLRRRGDVSSYLLAGVTAGFAIGSLQSGACVLPAIAAAVILRERRSECAGRASAWWILATLAIVAVFVRWLYPFHFVGEPADLSLVDRHGEKLLMLSGHEVFLDQFDGRGFANVLHALVCFDPLLLAAAVAGVVFFAARIASTSRSTSRSTNTSTSTTTSTTTSTSASAPISTSPSARRALSPLGKDLIVLLAQALPYLFMIGIYAQTFERFVLPLLPALALAGAFGVRAAIEALSRRVVLGRTATMALASSLPAIAAIPALRLAQVRAAPTTHDRVAHWIEANVSASERIVVVPQMDLPLFPNKSALAANARRPRRSDWLYYQTRMRPDQRRGQLFDILLAPAMNEGAIEQLQSDPLGYFRAHGARYVVFGLGSELVALARAHDALVKDAQRVLRVSPERVDSGDAVSVVTRHPDRQPGEPIFERPYAFWLFDSRCMGRTIEVFRLE